MERMSGKGHLARRCLAAREGTGPEILLEGPKAVSEVLRNGPTPVSLIFREGDEDALGIEPPPGLEVHEAERRLFAKLAGTVTPQGVLALVPRPVFVLSDVLAGTLALVLDGVQDPGNVGALIRAAAAFGASGVLVSDGSAHPYSARAVRASAGNVLRLPVVRSADWESLLREHGFRLAVGVAAGGEDPARLGWQGRWALVLGNEGHGTAAVGDRALTLPLARGVESLNVATAGAVLLYGMTRGRWPA